MKVSFFPPSTRASLEAPGRGPEWGAVPTVSLSFVFPPRLARGHSGAGAGGGGRAGTSAEVIWQQFRLAVLEDMKGSSLRVLRVIRAASVVVFRHVAPSENIPTHPSHDTGWPLASSRSRPLGGGRHAAPSRSHSGRGPQLIAGNPWAPGLLRVGPGVSGSCQCAPLLLSHCAPSPVSGHSLFRGESLAPGTPEGSRPPPRSSWAGAGYSACGRRQMVPLCSSPVFPLNC